MVLVDESPVGDKTSDTLNSLRIFLDDQVFGASGIKELDVRHGEHFAENSRREEGGVLHDNKISLIVNCDGRAVASSAMRHIKTVWNQTHMEPAAPGAAHELACEPPWHSLIDLLASNLHQEPRWLLEW